MNREAKPFGIQHQSDVAVVVVLVLVLVLVPRSRACRACRACCFLLFSCCCLLFSCCCLLFSCCFLLLLVGCWLLFFFFFSCSLEHCLMCVYVHSTPASNQPRVIKHARKRPRSVGPCMPQLELSQPPSCLRTSSRTSACRCKRLLFASTPALR